MASWKLLLAVNKMPYCTSGNDFFVLSAPNKHNAACIYTDLPVETGPVAMTWEQFQNFLIVKAHNSRTHYQDATQVVVC